MMMMIEVLQPLLCTIKDIIITTDHTCVIKHVKFTPDRSQNMHLIVTAETHKRPMLKHEICTYYEVQHGHKVSTGLPPVKKKE